MKLSTIKNVLLLIFLAMIVFFAVRLREMNNAESDRKEIGGLIVEEPRNTLPMGNETRLYTRRMSEFQTPGEKGDKKLRITYFWKEPELQPKQGEKLPLVVVLHGAPGNAYAGKYLATSPFNTRYPAYILVPVISQASLWDFPATVTREFPMMQGMTNPDIHHMTSYVAALASQAAKSYPIDPDRIYVVGCSQGGFGAFGAARDYPDIFAAAVSISGGWTETDAGRLLKTPILAIHGLKDQVIPAAFSRNVIKAIQDKGGRALYIEHAAMGHACPSAELYGETLWKWVFAQRKAK